MGGYALVPWYPCGTSTKRRIQMALKIGDKVRMLEDKPGYYWKGDTGTIVPEGPLFGELGRIPDWDGDYWVDFHDNGNAVVEPYRIVCIGKPGIDFELITEEA